MTIPTPTPHPPTCPKCGAVIDAATAVDPDDKDVPRTGDISICIKCGWVMIFDGDPALPRDLLPSEQLDVLSDPDIMAALIQIAVANRTRLQ
jgi:hypothetical protein